MQDDKIDYCIVTHAHTDHYAGFATSGKVQSLFDLFTYGTIIDFGGATNKKPDEGVLKKYITKRDNAIERDNAEYVDVSTEVTQKEITRFIVLGKAVKLNLKFYITITTTTT